jgi:uncharacterized membrane protein YccC
MHLNDKAYQEKKRLIRKINAVSDWIPRLSLISIIVLAFVFPQNAPGLLFWFVFIVAAWQSPDEEIVDVYWSVFKLVMYRLFATLICFLAICFMASTNVNWQLLNK